MQSEYPRPTVSYEQQDTHYHGDDFETIQSLIEARIHFAYEDLIFQAIVMRPLGISNLSIADLYKLSITVCLGKVNFILFCVNFILFLHLLTFEKFICSPNCTHLSD